MKKKIFSIVSFLLAALIFTSLVACGGSGDSKEVKLIMSTSKNQTETAGILLNYFCDQVEKATNGSVTFQRNWGGTLASLPEELGMLKNEAIDLAALQHPAFSDTIPLLQFPNSGPGSNEKSLNHFKHVIFENEASAKLIEAEAKASNVKYLGFLVGGQSIIACKFEAKKLSVMFGKKFGCGVNIPAFEAVGFSVVNMQPPAGYESLSRGVVDLANLSMAPAVNMKWYEVAPYFYSSGLFSVGNPLAVNLKKFNSLTPEQQQALIDAGKATMAYSLEMVNKAEKEYVSTIEKGKGHFKALSDDDQAYFFKKYYHAVVKDAYARAKKIGIEGNMGVVLNASAKYLEQDISDIVKK